MEPMRAWSGLDNTNRPEDIGLAGLVQADNVDMTRSKRVRVRSGSTIVLPGSPEAAWGDGRSLMWQDGGTLRRLLPGGAVVVASDLESTGKLWACEVNGLLYWSNGIQTGVVDGSSNRPWGVPLPPPPKAITETAGNLPAGRYMVTMTHIRQDGYESGAEPGRFVDVSLGGISIQVLPTEHAKAVYLSAGDGDVAFYAGRYAGEQTTIELTADTTALRLPLREQWVSPPPPGDLIAAHNGRMLIAQGQIVWATRPLSFESVDMRRDYIQMPSKVTMLAPFESGCFIGTEDGVWWASGADFADFISLSRVSESPPILGTQAFTDASALADGRPGQCVLWASPLGMWAGFQDGSAKALTDRKFSLPANKPRGCGFVRNQDGQQHYLCAI